MVVQLNKGTLRGPLESWLPDGAQVVRNIMEDPVLNYTTED